MTDATSQREVLFLRHKLQKGLLTREEKPQEQDMPGMHEYIKLLEKFGNLEVSIIRETKINKVLKAVLKLDVIPREAEFQFKKRSQVLLDKWNKLLASEASANGVNGSESHGDGKKTESNGVKADGDAKSAEPATTESKASKAEEAEVAKTDEVLRNLMCLDAENMLTPFLHSDELPPETANCLFGDSE